MKKIILILTLAIVIVGCDMKKHNSQDCKDRYDVQLTDGGAVWVYGGSLDDGCLKGNDEMGQKIYIPLHQIKSITEVDCGNGK